MPRKWRDFSSWESEDKRSELLRKTEKIRRTKRSVKGRTVDDWLVDADAKPQANFPKLSHLTLGRVIEVHKRGVFVAEEHDDEKPDTGLVWLCSVAKRHFQRSHKERNFVVVGDLILFEPDAGQELDDSGEPISDLPRGVIQHAYPRKTRIARKDPLNRDWEHVMLANIDQIVIVASVLHPEVRWGLIDRFLVQAELENLRAIVLLNKIDLLENEKIASPDFVQKYHERVQIYRSIGYEVYELSALYNKKHAKTRTALRNIFKGKITGFCGHSGVGKSSVINLMKPEIEQEVDENPDIFYKGRHTTTYNSLLRLGIGGYAIDTPGIRAFALDEHGPAVLASCFPEFRGIVCKYRECHHDKEAECRIKAAVETGEISKERYRSYIGLLLGVSTREGAGDSSQAERIADLKARQQMADHPHLIDFPAIECEQEGGHHDDHDDVQQ